MQALPWRIRSDTDYDPVLQLQMLGQGCLARCEDLSMQRLAVGIHRDHSRKTLNLQFPDGFRRSKSV